MRFSLMPLLVPAVLVALLAWGIHGLATKDFDRGWWWFLTIGSAVAGIAALALHVYTVDDRLRRLEQNIEKLSDRIYEREPGD